MPLRVVRSIGWVGLLLAAGVGAGFFSWPVTQPLQRLCGRLSTEVGWRLSLEEARWIPLRHLEVRDLRLSVPQGGRMHLVRAWISPRWESLLQGSLSTLWDLGEIRLDPGSWGIRRPGAQALISSVPVTTSGEALLKIGPERIAVERLSLEGPLLRLHVEGWLSKELWTHLSFQGWLARQVLEEMKLVQAVGERQEANPWEPFQMQLEGALSQPGIQFTSGFASFSFGRRQGSAS